MLSSAHTHFIDSSVYETQLTRKKPRFRKSSTWKNFVNVDDKKVLKLFTFNYVLNTLDIYTKELLQLSIFVRIGIFCKGYTHPLIYLCCGDNVSQYAAKTQM